MFALQCRGATSSALKFHIQNTFSTIVAKQVLIELMNVGVLLGRLCRTIHLVELFIDEINPLYE